MGKLIDRIIEEKILFVAKSTDKKTWIPLKNGFRTPIFLDTSKFISFPDILDGVNKYAIEIINKNNIKYDRILGLPYGGLPFAYGIINKLKVPALAIRKEGYKSYSTRGEILGNYKKGDIVLLIEDAIATAGTAVGFINKLRAKGLVVNDLITIVDTGSGGRDCLDKKGVNMHPLFDWRMLFEAYSKHNTEIDKELKNEIENIIDS